MYNAWQYNCRIHFKSSTMRRVLFFGALALAVFSCSDNSSTSNEADTTTVQAAPIINDTDGTNNGDNGLNGPSTGTTTDTTATRGMGTPTGTGSDTSHRR